MRPRDSGCRPYQRAEALTSSFAKSARSKRNPSRIATAGVLCRNSSKRLNLTLSFCSRITSCPSMLTSSRMRLRTPSSSRYRTPTARKTFTRHLKINKNMGSSSRSTRQQLAILQSLFSKWHSPTMQSPHRHLRAMVHTTKTRRRRNRVK